VSGEGSVAVTNRIDSYALINKAAEIIADIQKGKKLASVISYDLLLPILAKKIY
jgi:hypothetical protein